MDSCLFSLCCHLLDSCLVKQPANNTVANILANKGPVFTLMLKMLHKKQRSVSHFYLKLATQGSASVQRETKTLSSNKLCDKGEFGDVYLYANGLK